MQTTCFGTKLRGAERGRVIHIDGQCTHVLCRCEELCPVLFIELAFTQLMTRNVGLGADEALHKLLVAHLKAKDGGSLILPCGVHHNTVEPACLAHARTCCD